MSKGTRTLLTIQADAFSAPPTGWLVAPEGLTSFQQKDFFWEIGVPKQQNPEELNDPRKQAAMLFEAQETGAQVTRRYTGELEVTEEDRVCEHCGAIMHVQEHRTTRLKHVPSGTHMSVIEVERTRFKCPVCGTSCIGKIPFQSEHHAITLHAEHLIEDLTGMGFTLTQVSRITGVHPHIVKDIDLARLRPKYTENGKIRMPERQARILGIDEFSLHKGQKYATIIMDLETGAVLWIAASRSKQVVYDFISHVGLDWMKGVEAVCCDMNAGYPAAFLEKCPHLEIVYDRFHILKNFNDKVVSEVRKDEQRRLKAEGNKEAAELLKKSKYILTSSRDTLQKRDAEAQAGRLIRAGSDLFGMPDVHSKGGREERYDAILADNRLLFIADYVKEALKAAYGQTDRAVMEADILEIIEVCRSTDNRHFKWFANLLENHLEGITAHALYPYSTGKVEGMNNKIKTLRRKAYGFHDDEYFFLKIMDISRSRCG